MRSVDSESVVVVGSFAGELLCVGEEPSVLASGDLTDSLSLSCGHSFLICLRMFASARDPELDSVRPPVLSPLELLDPREPKLLEPELVRGFVFS